MPSKEATKKAAAVGRGKGKGFFADVGAWINKHPLGAAILGLIAGILVYLYFINPQGNQGQTNGGVPGNFDDEIIILGNALGNIGPTAPSTASTGPTPGGIYADTGANPWRIPNSNLQLQNTPGGVVTFGDTSLFSATAHAPTGQSGRTRGRGRRVHRFAGTRLNIGGPPNIPGLPWTTNSQGQRVPKI